MLEDHKQLRKLQLEQYKILQSVNDLCSKYGIEYYLLYGTLLGAVRHSKFIPWDYDISRNSAKQRKIFFTNILKTARVKGLLSF